MDNLFRKVKAEVLKIRTHLIIVSLANVCFAFYNYKINGVKIVNDSPRYIGYASNLQDGFFIDPHNFWYIGYPIYILVINSLGGNIQTIVFGQYFLSLLAIISLYFASLNLWNNRLGAFFTCLLFIVFIDIGLWTSYVLTESLYVSFICFSLYLLSLIYKGSTNKTLYITTFVTILFTILVKPTGIALFGALFFIFLTFSLKAVRSRLLRSFIVIACLTVFLVLVNKMLTTFLIMENYQKGEIIYAITTLPPRPEYQWMIISPPKDIYIPEDSAPPIIKIVNFIFHHPIYWTQLFFAKVFFLLAHIRPYWSTAHNIYSLGILLPCYYFFIRVVKREKLSMPVIFSCFYLAIHILSVAITSEDWDGRFLIPMLPVVFLFGGRGLYLQFQKFLAPG